MSNLILKTRNELEPRSQDVWGLQSDINRLFDAFINPFEGSEVRSTLSPRLDVAETKNKYEIKAELPGIDEKDINLSGLLYNKTRICLYHDCQ